MNIIKKLRPLDYLILAVILAVIVYFAFFIRSEESWVEVKTVSRDAPFYLTENYRVGDFELDPSGQKIAEITKKTLSPSRNELTNTRDMFLNVRILATVNKKTGEFQYKNRTLNASSQIEINFSSAILRGVVVSVNPQSTDLVYKTVTVRAYAQRQIIADSLKVGQGDGDALILQSMQIVPFQSAGQVVQLNRPLTADQNIDIIMKLKMLGEIKSGQFLVANSNPVMIGDDMSFYIGNVLIKDAVITKIDEQ